MDIGLYNKQLNGGVKCEMNLTTTTFRYQYYNCQLKCSDAISLNNRKLTNHWQLVIIRRKTGTSQQLLKTGTCTCHSSSDESGCAANENEQEIVNDAHFCFFSLADAHVFVDNLKVFAQVHGNTRLLQICMNAED